MLIEDGVKLVNEYKHILKDNMLYVGGMLISSYILFNVFGGITPLNSLCVIGILCVVYHIYKVQTITYNIKRLSIKELATLSEIIESPQSSVYLLPVENSYKTFCNIVDYKMFDVRVLLSLYRYGIIQSHDVKNETIILFSCVKYRKHILNVLHSQLN